MERWCGISVVSAQWVERPIDTPINPSLHPSIPPSIHPFIPPSIHPSLRPSTPLLLVRKPPRHREVLRGHVLPEHHVRRRGQDGLALRLLQALAARHQVVGLVLRELGEAGGLGGGKQREGEGRISQ
jgi:hypothetical protein